MSVKTQIARWAGDIRPLVDEIVAGGMPASAEVIYRGRNCVAKTTVEGRDVNIKEFRVPIFINRLVYTLFRKSKARRSYEYALRLRNLGFDTPEPLAWIELRSGILLGRSYYLCQQLDDFVELRRFYDWDDIPRLADQLGAMMVRMHQAGVWMKDFSPGNILRRRDAKGNYQLFLIDINRMEFGVTDRRKLMSSFRALTDDDRFLRLVARAYARHAHLDPETVAAEAIEAHRRFVRSRRLRHKLKGK